MSFRSITNVPSEVPVVAEKPNIEWVYYGEHNLYPLQLHDLKYGSPIHNSILKTKAKMMAGDGLLYNGAKTKEESETLYTGFPVNTKAEVDFLQSNKFGGMPLENLQDALAQDYQDYGAYCYKIIFNKDFTKIAGIKYYKVENIRSGKEVDGKIKNYYYSKDWTKSKQGSFKPEVLWNYDPKDREHIEQVIYRKIGNDDYYGITNYSGAINWVHIDFQMGIFHRSNIENGMNPGLHFKFYKTFANDEEEDRVREMVKKQWQGAMNAGKMIMTTSDGKDLAMDIQPIEVSGLDKQLLLLAELSDQKILTGHQLTTPMLAGITSNKGLGNTGTELETGYELFDGLSMASDRKVLRNDIQMWFDYNKTGVKVDINKFKPFTTVPKAQPQFTISQNG